MGSKDAAIQKKKVLTHRFRVSFPAVFEPQAFEDQEAKYSIVMLFDEDTDLGTPSVPGKDANGNPRTRSMKLAVKNAKIEKWGADPKKWPKNLREPFRDGSERADMDGYQGCIFVTATSKTQPGLVDQRLKPITAESDFYAGCYARAELIANAYNRKGNKGVSFSLQNIQKLDDGPKFSGKKDASTVFDAVEMPDEDEDKSDGEDSTEEDDGMGF